VIAIAPDRTAAPQHSVHGLRRADRETLKTAPELRRTVGLDEQVQMIGLNAELEEPKRLARRGGESRTNRWEDPRAAQRGEAAPRP
jgi:hypothetical protein